MYVETGFGYYVGLYILKYVGLKYLQNKITWNKKYHLFKSVYWVYWVIERYRYNVFNATFVLLHTWPTIITI